MIGVVSENLSLYKNLVLCCEDAELELLPLCRRPLYVMRRKFISVGATVHLAARLLQYCCGSGGNQGKAERLVFSQGVRVAPVARVLPNARAFDGAIYLDSVSLGP